MTQRKSELIKSICNTSFIIAITITCVIYKLWAPAILSALTAILNIVVSYICYKRTEVIKTLPVEQNISSNVEDTLEQHIFDDICSYALDKGLNPCIDAAPNGFFLNTSVDNKSIGICEIIMPEVGTKYLSDAYKSSVERVKEKIDDFIKDNPILVGENNA